MTSKDFNVLSLKSALTSSKEKPKQLESNRKVAHKMSTKSSTTKRICFTHQINNNVLLRYLLKIAISPEVRERNSQSRPSLLNQMDNYYMLILTHSFSSGVHSTHSEAKESLLQFPNAHSTAFTWNKAVNYTHTVSTVFSFSLFDKLQL